MCEDGCQGVRGTGELGKKKIQPMFNFVYIYIAGANLFSSTGKSEKYSHWIVRSSN